MISLPRKMLETYLERRRVDLETLTKSLQDGSVEEFNRIGHQLVGNARNFGFSVLEPLAAKMESLSSESLKEAGPRLLTDFTTWLEKAHTELASSAEDAMTH